MQRKPEINLQKTNLINIDRLINLGISSAGFSHDISTPLTSIKINLTQIQKSIKNQTLLDNTLTSIRQIDRLIDLYLKQTQYYDNMSFDPNEEIENTLELLNFKITKAQIKIILNLSKSVLQGNSTKFSQIITNLINNSIDAYNEIPYKQNDKTIIIESREIHNQYVLKVIDYGVGINPKELDKIFEAFYSTKGSLGTGLGLFICKETIEKHFEGTIKVTSTQNPTQFQITIPIKE